jgi:hypothetical protein
VAGVGVRETVSCVGMWSSVSSTSARVHGAKTAKASNTRERNIKKIVLRGKTVCVVRQDYGVGKRGRQGRCKGSRGEGTLEETAPTLRLVVRLVNVLDLT